MEIIKNYINKKNSTLLGVGPMSLNCVDASIEIANEYNVPLMMIASRRQIDCKELGGGYVNNWNTEEYSEYIKKYDKKNNIKSNVGAACCCRSPSGHKQTLTHTRQTHSTWSMKQRRVSLLLLPHGGASCCVLVLVVLVFGVLAE